MSVDGFSLNNVVEISVSLILQFLAFTSNEANKRLWCLNCSFRKYSVLLKTQPEEGDVQLFLTEVGQVMRNIISSFQLSPWNYCHSICAHMKNDLIALREIGFSLLAVSVSRIECIGATMRGIWNIGPTTICEREILWIREMGLKKYFYRTGS